MKVAFLAESEADEEALRIFVEFLCGSPVEVIAGPRLRTRGWPSIREVLPKVLRHVHYRTDAAGFAVLVDSDQSLPHDASHGDAERNDRCRTCCLRTVIEGVRTGLRPRADGSFIRIALATAIPALEAWFLCGRDGRVGEAPWGQALKTGRLPYTRKDLKRMVYGTEIPSQATCVRVCREEAQRLTRRVADLERSFPAGFGSFAEEVRRWRRTSSPA